MQELFGSDYALFVQSMILEQPEIEKELEPKEPIMQPGIHILDEMDQLLKEIETQPTEKKKKRFKQIVDYLKDTKPESMKKHGTTQTFNF